MTFEFESYFLYFRCTKKCR